MYTVLSSLSSRAAKKGARLRGLLRIGYAVLRAPFWLALQPITLVSRWSGGGKNLTASVTHNLAANLICGALGWCIFGAGAYFENPWHAPWPKPCQDQEICVVLAGLQDDDSGASQTKHVRASLIDAFRAADPNSSIQVIVVPRRLESSFSGDVAKDELTAREIGWNWLKELNGDILIYGDVASKDRALELHFLAKSGDFGDEALPTGGRYALNARLVLPNEFRSDLATAIAAYIVTSVSRIGERRPRLVRKLAIELQQVVDSQSLSVTLDARLRMIKALALLYLVLRDDNEMSSQFTRGILIYQNASPTELRGLSPQQRADADATAAIMMIVNGVREHNEELLHSAVAAATNQANNTPRSERALDWISAQNNLAVSYLALAVAKCADWNFQAKCKPGTGADRYLDQAKRVLDPAAFAAKTQNSIRFDAAIEAALIAWSLFRAQENGNDAELYAQTSIWMRTIQKKIDVRSLRDINPINLTQFAAGLDYLGEERKDAKLTSEAVHAYRTAQTAFDPALQPVQWAKQTALVASELVKLGQLTRSDDDLNRAVNTYQRADRACAAVRYFECQIADNLHIGDVFVLLAQEHKSLAYYRKAVSFYRRVLTTELLRRLPVDWAAVQVRIGKTLRLLSELEGRRPASRPMAISDLKAATLVLKSAAAVYATYHMKPDFAGAERELGFASFDLGVESNDLSVLRQTVQIFRNNVSLSRAPLDAAGNQLSLAIALHSIWKRSGDWSALEESAYLARGSSQVFHSLGEPALQAWAIASENYGSDLLRLSTCQQLVTRRSNCPIVTRKKRKKNLQDARDALSQALTVFRNSPASFAAEKRTEEDLKSASSALRSRGDEFGDEFGRRDEFGRQHTHSHPG